MNRIHLATLLVIFTVFVGIASAQKQGTEPKTVCNPIETKPPNAEEQKPKFPQQTRACEVKSNCF
jgi:hypothetical protein